jgi:hypothetical protein
MNQNSSTGNIIGVNAGQDIGYLAQLKGIQKNVSWWRCLIGQQKICQILYKGMYIKKISNAF